MNAIFMTKEEANLSVFIDQKVDKFTFTNKHLETSKRLICKDAHPKIYGSLAPKGIVFLNEELVDVSNIDSDNEFFSQGARVNVNPAYFSIRSDVEQNGYSLAQLPIMLMKLKSGKYVVLEGRTRFNILINMGCTNIIAHVFDETTPANALRFATMMNSENKPYGEATVMDIEKTILRLVEYGEISNEQSMESFVDQVLYEINIISTKLNATQVSTICHKAREIKEGVQQIISFPEGRGAKEWLDKHGYTDNREVVYFPIASYIDKTFSRIIKAEEYYGPDVKEIRLIVHTGTPDGRNPENHWIKKGVDFKKRFDMFERQISKYRFGNAKPTEGRTVLYGAIPQVKSLSKKYPMNSLHIYK